MKKICIVKEDITQKGGSERIACLLMNELSIYFDIICISIKKTNEEPAYFLDSRVKLEYLSLGSKKIRSQIFSLIIKYTKILIKNKIDIVINIGVLGITVSFISKFIRNKVKIISCEHSNLNNLSESSRSKRMCQYLMSKFSDKIITLTEKDKNNYKKKYNLIEKNTDYIFNFIDKKLLELDVVYNTSSKKIITVGRFEKVKGYDRLIKIAKEVLIKNKNWKWDIYGDGEEFENIKKMIKEYKLENQLILKGKVENIYDLYQEYSFYVMTSYYEGLPMVLLEAKANKLPLISFDIDTGPSEIIRNEIDGFLIENNNIDEMVKQINYLIENLDIRKSFSNKSRENLEKFEKSKIINKWINLIENI